MLNFRSHLSYALVLLVAVVAACGGTEDDVGETEEGRLVLGQTEERMTMERGIAPGGRLVVFEGFNGDIHLESSGNEFASLEFVKIARAQDVEAARKLLEQVSVAEEGSDTEYRYLMQSPNQQRTAVNLNGAVPENANLRIDWQSGAISLSGPDGPLHITNGNGRVDVAGVSESVEIRVQNGGILLGVERLSDDAEIVLETSNGDITLSLPVEASAQVVAETKAGEIRATDLQFQDRKLETMGAGAAFEGRLGRATAKIRIRTDNGTIHLKQGRMERLSPPDSAMADTTAATPIDTAAVDTVR